MLTDERPTEVAVVLPDLPPPPKDSRRLDIQGLRAIAVILVVAFHAGLPIPGGFIGVDVFLVISGFVITSMLMRELQRSGTIRFRNFYSRRIKRLLPALAVVTTVVMGMSVFLGSSFGSQQTTAETGVGATLFSANIVIYNDSTEYFSPEAATNPLLNTWTLSVEEQVYLVFPALLLGSWVAGRLLLELPSGAAWDRLSPSERRRLTKQALRSGKVAATATASAAALPASSAASADPAGGRIAKGSLRASQRSAAIMLLILSIASFILCFLVSFGLLPLPRQFAFFSSLARAWEFAVGAGLALGAASLARIKPGPAVVAGLAGTVMIVVGAFTITGATPYPGAAVLLPVTGAAALIISGMNSKKGLQAVLGSKPMVKVGDLSYSWYLWHWPLIVFAAIVWPGKPWVLALVGLASLIPAWLSMSFLEDPIRKKESIKGMRVVGLAAACTIIPIAASLGLAYGAETSWGNEQVAAMQSQVTAEHAGQKAGCDNASTADPDVAQPSCEFNGAATGPQVYLEGNSVAAMYSEALIGSTEKLGLPLKIATSPGCFSGGDEENSACSDDFETTVERLARRKPGVIVMSSTWDLGALGSSATQTLTPKQRADDLIGTLGDAVTRLRHAGHEVLLVLPTPRFFYGSTPGTFSATPPDTGDHEPHAFVWRPRDCTASVTETDLSACGATVPESEVKQSQTLTFAALKEVARTTGAATLNLRDHYCIDGTCVTNLEDRWLYEDGIHISVEESEALVPEFVRALDRLVRENLGYDPNATGATTADAGLATATPVAPTP